MSSCSIARVTLHSTNACFEKESHQAPELVREYYDVSDCENLAPDTDCAVDCINRFHFRSDLWYPKQERKR